MPCNLGMCFQRVEVGGVGKESVHIYLFIYTVQVLVLQAPNKILYESYKVLHASYKEVWLFLGRNIVFQLATERTIFFSKQSQVCLEVIY